MDKQNRLGWSGFLFVVLWLVVFSANVSAYTVTSPFGWRIHPVRNRMEFHTGIDISMSYGSAIPALFDGEVVWAATRDGYGNTVILHHFDDTYTLYGHCATICVVTGQEVKAGETIAFVGNSGVSTGPHLHLEYWVHNHYVNPMVIWNQAERPKPTR